MQLVQFVIFVSKERFENEPKMWCITSFILIVTALYVLYKWSVQSFAAFKQRGIAYEQPWPIIGNLGKVLTSKIAFSSLFLEMYRKNKQQ